LYQGKLLQTASAASSASVEAYNEIVTSSLSFVFAEMDSPRLLDEIGQLSSGSTAQVRKAIHTLASHAWPVKAAAPWFVELRSSMEAFAMYFAFICDADPASMWRGDQSLCARFFADLQQLCGCEIADEDLLSCWYKVSRDFVGRRAKDTGYAALLTRSERAEVRAWRERRVAATAD
jgi:hypothetical protein